MKKMIKALAVTAALTMPAFALAGTGILGTDHDFASGTSGTNMALQFNADGTPNPLANQVGLCSYCHTPHSAISTSLLWNHTLSANTFTWDDATTTGGTPYATITPSYKGPTVKCLSCHDGSVAIGDVAMYKETATKDAVSAYNTYKVGGDGMTTKLIGSAGKMGGNHPVAMPYPLGNVAGTYNGVTTGSDLPIADFVADPTGGGAGTNGTHIKLYKAVAGNGAPTGGTAAGASGIECSTCHDPHNKASVDDFFLRGKIAGSTASDGYICIQCHTK